ncbi:hypothetical protein HNV08_09985 [Winogradskyella eckloniae]|uniref:DUF7793 family protein n=1 Tax=Winogradskyella eckloniae TaxID=1089306 RepID=UPI001884FC54|nr:hypothetical protein [Winogradskyella eckloniae]NRD20376.1 hypothetical protein [Winogradskyella eckloniae]
MSKVIGFNNAVFWTDHTEILYCEFNNSVPNLKLEQKVIESYIEAIANLCNEKPMPFLIDLKETRGTYTISIAKLIAKNQELEKLKITESYVINSAASRLLIGFYRKMYNDVTPIGLFKDYTLAKDYCLNAKQTYYKKHIETCKQTSLYY